MPSGPPFPLLPPSAYVPVVMGTRENGKGNSTGLKIYNGGSASAKVRSAGVSISYKWVCVIDNELWVGAWSTSTSALELLEKDNNPQLGLW